MTEYYEEKKLYRSPKNALLFGIAAGIAHYFSVDVVFVRLAIIVLTFLSGIWPMVLIYLVAIFLVPVDPAQETVASTQEPKDVTPKTESMDREQNV